MFLVPDLRLGFEPVGLEEQHNISTGFSIRVGFVMFQLEFRRTGFNDGRKLMVFQVRKCFLRHMVRTEEMRGHGMYVVIIIEFLPYL